LGSNDILDSRLTPSPIEQNTYGRGFEAVRSFQAELGTEPDLKEDYSIGREIPKDHPSFLQGKLGCGPNLWPRNIDNRDEFQQTTMEYFNAVYDFAEDIVTVLALSLGLDATGLDGLKNEPRVGIMKYQYYPQLPEGADPEVTRGFGAHIDVCPLAIILQEDVAGLQVQDEATGDWVTVGWKQSR
jgi:isopenicillin N synthase-like dioxygenase